MGHYGFVLSGGLENHHQPPPPARDKDSWENAKGNFGEDYFPVWTTQTVSLFFLFFLFPNKNQNFPPVLLMLF